MSIITMTKISLDYHMATLVEDCTGIYAQTCSSIDTDVVEPNLAVVGIRGY